MSTVCRSSTVSRVMCATGFVRCCDRLDLPWWLLSRCARHRREYHDLQRRQCGALPPAAVRRSRQAGRDLRAEHETGIAALADALDHDRVARAGAVVRADRGHRRVCRGEYAVGRRRGGAGQDSVSDAGCIPAARCQTGARPGFYARGCRSREPLRDHQRRVMAAPICRRRRRPRADDPCGRQALAHRGRDAGWRLDGPLDAERRHVDAD